jgi:fructose-bisphosphate aldolase class I
MKAKYNPGIIANDEGLKNLCKKYSIKFSNNSIKKIYNFRNLIFSNPFVNKNIFGIILHEDDFLHKEGENFIKNLKKNKIKIGMKFDSGRKVVSKNKLEKISFGFKEIRKKILIYKKFNCSFAKWKIEFNVYDNSLSDKNIKNNVETLIKFVTICLKNNILPMIETDLTRNSRYSLNTAITLTAKIYILLNTQLKKRKIKKKILFKTNLIYPGKGSILNHKISANRTKTIISEYFGKNIKNIFFLSGGEKDDKVIKTIKILQKEKSRNYSFAFGRGFFYKVDNFFTNQNKNEIFKICNQKIKNYKNLN